MFYSGLFWDIVNLIKIGGYYIFVSNNCLYWWTYILGFAALKPFGFVTCKLIPQAWSSIFLNPDHLNLNLRILAFLWFSICCLVCGEIMYLHYEDWYFWEFVHFSLDLLFSFILILFLNYFSVLRVRVLIQLQFWYLCIIFVQNNMAAILLQRKWSRYKSCVI